jgi:DNA-binding XRE family transcriptional regulator
MHFYKAIIIQSEAKLLEKMKFPNRVKEYRDNLMMSKAELARTAGISVQTLNRIEKGEACRVDTQRKILQSLNLQVTDKEKIFNAVPTAS